MSRSTADRDLLWGLRAAALLSGTVLILILVFLVIEALPALEQVGIHRFLGDATWRPTREATSGRFGLVPMLVGTLATTAGALGLAIPTGLGSALFCYTYAPNWLAQAYRHLLELLAGIPSVVYGFWGMVALVPLLGALEPPGASLLAAVLVLALMILPTLALLAQSALTAVPRSHTQGAAALGLSRWATLAGVVLPAARSGLFTAAILATGRALGETMAVLMVAGNVAQIPDSLLDPVRTLTANIALDLGYAAGTHRSALFVSGLLLMVMVTVLMLAAQVIHRRYNDN